MTTIISMFRKISRVALVLLLLILAVGIFLRLRGTAMPGLPLPSLSSRFDAAVRLSDSVAIVDVARARCRLLWGRTKRACLEQVFLDLVFRDQVPLAMASLDILGRQDPMVRRFGHDFSHVIGINAWRPGKDIGGVYAQCTELFQSGCYHGVVQAYFAYQGTDSATVAALCRGNPVMRDNAWLHFQCVHGIGHGLVQSYTMNLPRALAGCDMLGNYYDSESCYGGAFMEFIVGGRGQSHHVHLAMDSAKGAATANADGEHEGMHHDMDMPKATGDTWPPFSARSKSDLLYPCSVLAQKYGRQCYQMQAGLIVEVTGMDFRKVAQVCDQAPEMMRKPCYQGIGTYVSGVTSRDAEQAIAHCSLGAPRWRPWCFVGVVKNFVDVTANTDDGVSFCRRLGPRDIALTCWVAVGEEAAILYPAMERREAVCRAVETQYADACRFGAGISAIRPDGLPTG